MLYLFFFKHKYIKDTTIYRVDETQEQEYNAYAFYLYMLALLTLTYINHLHHRHHQQIYSFNKAQFSKNLQ